MKEKEACTVPGLALGGASRPLSARLVARLLLAFGRVFEAVAAALPARLAVAEEVLVVELPAVQTLPALHGPGPLADTLVLVWWIRTKMRIILPFLMV